MSADDKDELGGRMADLEKGLEVGLNEMEKKIEAVQQGLTDRVTQMEVAIMGAIKKSGGGRDERSHSNAGLLAPPTANGTLDNEEDSFRMSEDKAVELARTGHSVLMMQGLVDGDTEIRSLMQGLRTRSNRAKLTRTATTNLSGEDMKKSSRCCPTADSPGGRSLRGCLKVVFCNIPVLHPDHRFRSLWNAALALLILYCGIAIPLGTRGLTLFGESSMREEAACVVGRTRHQPTSPPLSQHAHPHVCSFLRPRARPV